MDSEINSLKPSEDEIKKTENMIQSVQDALKECIADDSGKDDAVKPNPITVKFSREYELDATKRDIPWELSYCAVTEDDKVLFQIDYRLEGTTSDEGYGQQHFHLYVVENNQRLFCKCVDLMPLCGEAEKCCRRFFRDEVSYVEEIATGIFVPEYNNRVLSHTEQFDLDDGFDVQLKRLSQVRFGGIDLFDCKYSVSLLHYNCYDFVNRHVFHADGFCLRKYAPYVELLNYLFSLSENKHLVPSPIRYVDDLHIAEAEMVLRRERQIENDRMIR